MKQSICDCFFLTFFFEVKSFSAIYTTLFPLITRSRAKYNNNTNILGQKITYNVHWATGSIITSDGEYYKNIRSLLKT